jgi:two-component sensor histidine kinase
MGSWGMLADLSFSDLVLFAPDKQQVDSFIVLGQMRPGTSQTVFELDLVGRVISADELSVVRECWQKGAILSGDWSSDGAEATERQVCIPVRWQNEIAAVLTRVWSPRASRRTGSLERVYLRLFDQLMTMVASGLYPFVTDEAAVEEAPRVGDGVIVLDANQRISFASPNAVNALHRMEIKSASIGSRLSELEAIGATYSRQIPVFEEIERRRDVIVLFHCIPLIEEGRVVGAALLLRDVTDLRRRDRLLLSKDAAIREVHHRVKNNLQTISSLLRLQSRRVDDRGARDALMEAERRVSAIALVHEILAHEPGDQVPFGEIVPALVHLARDANVTPRELDVRVHGDAGDLSADVATPLSVVISELLQNAAEHAFDPDSPSPSRIDVSFSSKGDSLRIEISDNGKGFAPDFDIESTRSLGLAIVRDLVRGQLGGTITIESTDGALVRLEIPLDSPIGQTS